jgi:hypothetical protein
MLNIMPLRTEKKMMKQSGPVILSETAWSEKPVGREADMKSAGPDRVDSLEKQKHPRGTVKEQVEPVDGAAEFAPRKHIEFLPEVGRMKWCQPDDQAGKDQNLPGESAEKVFHKGPFDEK